MITAIYARVTAEESFKKQLSVPAQIAEGERIANTRGVRSTFLT